MRKVPNWVIITLLSVVVMGALLLVAFLDSRPSNLERFKSAFEEGNYSEALEIADKMAINIYEEEIQAMIYTMAFELKKAGDIKRAAQCMLYIHKDNYAKLRLLEGDGEKEEAKRTQPEG
jgi:hypothetical protein